MMALFDAYLVVEWSARSAPRQGANSIWYCLFENTESDPESRNPPTRDQAAREIEDALEDLVSRRKRVLVSFNFAYSYPAGLAAALGLEDPSPWSAVWRELTGLIKDDESNRDNRLQVAAELNKRLSGEPGPFWGRPTKGDAPESLAIRKPSVSTYDRLGLSEQRIVERHAPKPRPVWQVYHSGSTGGLTLVGLPRLEHLRSHRALKMVTLVWPFQWSYESETAVREGRTLIVHAEVYPPVLGAEALEKEGKLRVTEQARILASWDRKGRLLGCLNAPLELPSADERRAVFKEEGWILGITGLE